MKHDPRFLLQSSYLSSVFKNPAEVVNKLKKKLEHRDFDTIVVRGVSGLLVGPIIAYVLNKHLVVIRKPNESTHSAYRVEGILGGNYVIIDDLMASGNTVITIKQKYEEACESANKRCKFMGTFLYLDNGDEE